MQPITLKQVAQQLGLAASTVSRALRNDTTISQGTTRRVQQVAAELHYQPNSHARSLRTQLSGTLAVVVPEVGSHFLAQAIRGIEEVARQRRYQVLLCATHQSPVREAEALYYLSGGFADGILLAPVAGSTLTGVANRRPPVVVFGQAGRAASQASVTADEYASSYQATAYLLQGGCRRVALLLPSYLPADNSRVQGYADALRAQGISLVSRLLVRGANTAAGLAQLATLLRGQPAIDGIFAAGSQLALVGYQACQTAGCRIPHDVQIIGFSSPEVAALLSPALTTVSAPAHAIGGEATRLLFRAIAGQETLTAAHSQVLLPQLEPRASTLHPLAT